MKSIISFIGISAIYMAALFAVTHTEQVQDTIKWNKTTHDFGTVKLGPKADAEFTFKNDGAAPVTIQAARPSCGCTASEYSIEPILPGQSGFVKASYGTEGRPCFFKKTITVNFDNGSTQVLTITGTVSTDVESTVNEL